ncbi:MAG: hypothetical protein IAF38_18980 [Bacteroidia bacterium]|nr:hypothetical protein [Bacteroidia bacterium]
MNFVAKGYSDEIPAATNSTKEGREKNRRVELFFIPLEDLGVSNPK